MRIAQISTPHERTPPETTGGIERVVSLLTEGLVERGHQVTLYATGDSRSRASLRYFYPSPARPYSPTREIIHFAQAYRDFHSYDIVHNHCFLGAAFTRPGGPVAQVTTLHWTLDDAHSPLLEAFPDHNYIALSRWQRDAMPRLNVVDIIPNAVDLAEYPLVEKKAGYLLFIGRMDPRKGPDVAVQVARQAGMPLVLAGKLKAENEPYFRQTIAPYLDDRIRYVGEVGGQVRTEVFANAAALLFPIRWEEPFGLVLIEAMACGTPVLAFRRGAVPEVVQDGVTGFVVSDAEAMAGAVGRLGEVSPVECRRLVESRFSKDILVQAHLALYQRLLGK